MTSDRAVEISWFSALCDDDYAFLGVPDPALQSSFEHCRDIVLTAETGGFDSVLLPSGYKLGIDSLAFAAGMAPLSKRIHLLTAIRCGELWPPQQMRQLATLDQMLQGRLKINIISSDMPGEQLAGEARYERSREYMKILRDLFCGKPVEHHGRFYDLVTDPPRLTSFDGKPPLTYFGGLSDLARDVAAEQADVYLMWPDRLDAVQGVIADLSARAASHGRTLKFGYRVHVIVRETDSEARLAAQRLLSRLDDGVGRAIRTKSLDSGSFGVSQQTALRDSADAEGYVEDHLWSGIGRARSGCGAAIVGDPDQVAAKLRQYQDIGFDAFILSGYPHQSEADLFARYVLPQFQHAPLIR